MKNLILMLIVICFIGGCANLPQKSNLVVRYPLEGEIEWSYSPGSTDQDPQFIIDYEDLKEFIIWTDKEIKNKEK